MKKKLKKSTSTEKVVHREIDTVIRPVPLSDQTEQTTQSMTEAATDKVGEVASNAMEGVKNFGEKTADIAKTVGSKTVEGAKLVGAKTAEGAKYVAGAIAPILDKATGGELLDADKKAKEINKKLKEKANDPETLKKTKSFLHKVNKINDDFDTILMDSSSCLKTVARIDS